jgi:hypothetical protein
MGVMGKVFYSIQFFLFLCPTSMGEGSSRYMIIIQNLGILYELPHKYQLALKGYLRVLIP